jgi:ABC-type Fe3+-siderophore transport system permease subunit
VAVNLRGLMPGTEPNASTLVLEYSYLPRLAMSLLCGAALGLASALLQQLLQNPLAAPDTLAVSAGAQLSLTIGILVFPVFHASHPEFLALAGAAGGWALIAAVAWRRRGDPITLILVGFIVSFALGSIASLLMLLHQEYLTSLLIWGAGSLAQDDWDGVLALGLRLAGCALLTALMVRPLLILGFGDQSARSLGVSLRFVRPLLLAMAIGLSASVVAFVGVIGFVGLAAPHLARVAGAERLASRLILAPLAGAWLLATVDQALQWSAGPQSSALPTGAITALLGAPLLILLLRRIPSLVLEGSPAITPQISRPRGDPGRVLVGIALTLVVALAAALLIGRTPIGFTLGLDLDSGAFEWRVPRVLAAGGAGLALGVAGCLVQRLFANPMASPEVLGIGGGVAVGLIVVLLASAEASSAAQFAGAIGGALIVSALILSLGGHRGFSPERLLLIGIAITALVNAMTLLFLAMGDPRIGQVLAWLGGSTYRVTLDFALVVVGLACLGLLAALPLSRWLDILPLGDDVTRGLGVPAPAVRMLVLVLAAVTTATAAIVVGPLSFVGLLAPHFASLAGLRRARVQLMGAAGAGASLVIFADWIGRVIFAPTELPAGILSVLIGCALVAAFLGLRRGVAK